MTAIRVEKLRKTFGTVQALDNLSFTVENGAVFGFLGPNGAGKTTTIRILTGLAHPSSGRAWVTGMNISTFRREIAHRIGYLPEAPAFYPWMTPLEFLEYVGRIFGLTSEEQSARAEELLELAGLTDVRKRRIGGFSRGMRQRLALAQALINRPQVLFLDEPTSALDPVGRKEILELIDRLRGQCTVFMSTHILADAERVCDTIGIIAHGRMVVEAPRAELLSRYATPVFEIECDSGQADQVTAWAKTLRQMRWITDIAVTGSAVRVVVSDVEKAKRELPAAVVQAGLALTRYEMVQPSLEDVFLRLVHEEKTG